VRTRVGYTGGTLSDPTYHHLGDHTEAFQVDYDPSRTSYEQLLELFWSSHSPGLESINRQYMAAVFYQGDGQRRVAVDSRERIAAGLDGEVCTILAPLERFHLAEHYHQKYYLHRRADLLEEFRAYSPQQFVDSTVAARLNGYVAGQGSVEQLAQELESFGLSGKAASTLERTVRASARHVGSS
jgi:peptide-methionine (S)-S-oxide reductase